MSLNVAAVSFILKNKMGTGSGVAFLAKEERQRQGGLTLVVNLATLFRVLAAFQKPSW